VLHPGLEALRLQVPDEEFVRPAPSFVQGRLSEGEPIFEEVFVQRFLQSFFRQKVLKFPIVQTRFENRETFLVSMF
jgi:hypothetical protein